MLARLDKIIGETDTKPHITNDKSSFVVTTYWWGRGNLNGNTARPCVSFYETFIKYVRNAALSTINTIFTEINKAKDAKLVVTSIQSSRNLETLVYHSPKFNEITTRVANAYLDDVYKFALNEHDRRLRPAQKNIAAIKHIERMKRAGKTPANYEFKEFQYIQDRLKIVGLLFLMKNKNHLLQLSKLNKDVEILRAKYRARSDFTDSGFITYKSMLAKYSKAKDDLAAEMKRALTTPQTYAETDIQNIVFIDEGEEAFMGNRRKRGKKWGQYSDRVKVYIDDFQGKSIYEVLNAEFRYLSPIKFEEMITLWEDTCAANGCNHMAVEYAEFAKPGGYQMAINAKPMFIRKMLELCGPRNVLYIDGDMLINKYPDIFDMPDVDFMARGWWIDPRSSYSIEESITIDPYTFETSGGTMFFAQSLESKRLIECWIEESSKPYQAGKADDRILSLVFNTKKFLLSMKILQLPVEYLWLTLDYDDRMMEFVYWGDEETMKKTIYIEHPECLTTEDTAGGAGASSDRTPKFYSFLEETIPVSEEIQEYVMFPAKKFADGFKDYHDYLGGLTYMDDGNPLLYSQGFVVHGQDAALNASPMYITNYGEKYGNKKRNYDGEQFSPNEVVEMNASRAKKVDLAKHSIVYLDTDLAEINSPIPHSTLIPIIIHLLQKKINVVYNPTYLSKNAAPGASRRRTVRRSASAAALKSSATGNPRAKSARARLSASSSPDNKAYYNPEYFTSLMTDMNNKFHNMEFMFVPRILDTHENPVHNRNNIFKPQIQIEQPMFFRHGNFALEQLLLNSISLEQISYMFETGAYQYISKIRIGYIMLPRHAKPSTAAAQSRVRGGGEHSNSSRSRHISRSNSSRNRRRSITLSNAHMKAYSAQTAMAEYARGVDYMYM